jgi:hypothetical protein
VTQLAREKKPLEQFAGAKSQAGRSLSDREDTGPPSVLKPKNDRWQPYQQTEGASSELDRKLREALAKPSEIAPSRSIASRRRGRFAFGRERSFWLGCKMI